MNYLMNFKKDSVELNRRQSFGRTKSWKWHNTFVNYSMFVFYLSVVYTYAIDFWKTELILLLFSSCAKRTHVKWYIDALFRYMFYLRTFLLLSNGSKVRRYSLSSLPTLFLKILLKWKSQKRNKRGRETKKIERINTSENKMLALYFHLKRSDIGSSCLLLTVKHAIVKEKVLFTNMVEIFLNRPSLCRNRGCSCLYSYWIGQHRK